MFYTDSETLRHLVKETRRSEIKDAGYYFCKEPDCETLYYHPESGQTFEKIDLTIHVGLKETEDPVWVCYCFDISKKMIQEEAVFIRNTPVGSCPDKVKITKVEGIQ